MKKIVPETLYDFRFVSAPVFSPDGRRAEVAHRYFHRRMVRAITSDLEQAERDAMIAGLRKMNSFLQMSLAEFVHRKEEEL